ncbi:hypothetical protein HDV03_001593 [Kappamyces sp. JEL0829]|nr:hypothetical protein HDV03_001593 [Kappamyces sp. JEL0829]
MHLELEAGLVDLMLGSTFTLGLFDDDSILEEKVSDIYLVSMSPDNSLPWMEAQWLTNDYCTGVPNSFHVFYADVGDWGSNGQIYPGIYYLGSHYPFNPCGSNPASSPLSGNCCTSSLDVSARGSRGVLSGTDYPLDTLNMSDAALSSHLTHNANGYIYCYLSAADPDSQLFDSFSSVLYLNDGSCIDEYTYPVSCSRDGVVTFYANPHCQDPLHTLPLTDESTFYPHTPAGNVTARLLEVTGASEAIGWVEYEPALKLFPTFKNPLEIVSVGFWILTLLLHTICVAWAAIHYRRTPKGILIFIVFSQVLWLVRAVSFMVYIYCDAAQLAIDWFCLLANASYGWATLTSVSYTFVAFNRIIDPPRWVKAVVVAVLASLHVGLLGGYYAAPLFSIILEGNPSLYYKSTFNQLLYRILWNELVPLNTYWQVVVFVWNTAVLLWITRKCLAASYRRPASLLAHTLYRVDPKLCKSLVALVLCVVCYAGIVLIMSCSTVLQNDRTFNSFGSSCFFFEALHGVLSLAVCYRLPQLPRKLVPNVSALDAGASVQ